VPDISDAAKTQYRADYEFTRRTGRRTCSVPTCAAVRCTGPQGHVRVYLHIDDDERVVTVGYVGPHLRDATNP
jgi:hypothetical protein